MVIRRTDYTAEAVAAARSVLLEVVHTLGEYRDDIVIVGGWVPELLLSGDKALHVGSIDVDLALNHRTLQEPDYKTILMLLRSRGYEIGEQPFIFYRKVKVGEQEYTVQVDFLAGEYGGTGKKHRTQKVQDIRPRKARGVDLAFEMLEKIEIAGELPEDGKDATIIQVSAIAPFLVMKGIALSQRLKEKDAWDIYFCIRNYPGGVDALINEFSPILGHPLVQEGLHFIAEKFSSPESIGPTYIADFESTFDPEDRALLQRDAYERVNYLLNELGIR